jgi:peptidoglycan/xylan/chitin deacetylase (PgdA/CDA1 family)
LAKALLADGVHYAGLLAGWRRLRAAMSGPRVHIFAFHRVVPDFRHTAAQSLPALCTSLEIFELLLVEILRRMEVVDLATAVDRLRGHHPFERDVAVITFDDGYRDNYTHAFPVLRRLGVPACLFVPTRFVGGTERLPHDRLYGALRAACEGTQSVDAPPEAERWAAFARARGPALAVERATRSLPHAALLRLTSAAEAAYGSRLAPDPDALPLTWEMCATMARAGLEIGTHTCSHAALGHEPRRGVREELASSRAEIERRLGAPARFVAYPNGVYSNTVLRLCRELGFDAGLTTEDHPNRRGADPARLGRKLLWEAHGRGIGGRPSPALVAFHVENVKADLLGPLCGNLDDRSATSALGREPR